jgi:hypothetical protein
VIDLDEEDMVEFEVLNEDDPGEADILEDIVVGSGLLIGLLEDIVLLLKFGGVVAGLVVEEGNGRVTGGTKFEE